MPKISTAEAAALLGVSIRTIHRLVASGALKPLLKYPGKTGGFLFARSTIDRYMSRRTADAA